MLDRLTDRARKVMTNARNEAQDLGCGALEPEHVLLGILDGGGSALRILEEAGIDADDLRDEIFAAIDSDPDATFGPLSVGPRAQKALHLAQEECSQLERGWIATEHLLLGVLGAGGPSSALLARHGASVEAIREKARATTLAE